MKLDDPVIRLAGVGEELAKKYSIIGITTLADLIQHFPRRYEDYSCVQSIGSITPGPVTIRATIRIASGRYGKRARHITEAIASDETGSVRIVWFNQPYKAQSIKTDQEYFISGEFALKSQRLSILSPSIEPVNSFPISTARIVPVYKETKGLTSVQIRKALRQVLPLIESMSETLPNWLIARHKLMSYSDSIKAIHFPESNEQLLKARSRLGFEEVFQLTLASLINKYELSREAALVIPFEEKLAKDFVAHLPFKLTDAQRKVTWQIYKDMQRVQPMNRMVEGDVGSGKTVVATMAAMMAMQQGYQAALMAPTELLARQHAETIHGLLKAVGMEAYISLLVGGMPAVRKKEVYQHIKTGDVRFIIGTHALLQQKVDMHRLGLIIIDEQHRFGVEQRKTLQAKAGHMPHVLSMTATPIPRSLALTLYGELDISIIDVKPSGRKHIQTKITSPNSRKQLYEQIDIELTAGRQMFVVCPLISDSDALDARSAEQVYDELAQRSFKHRRVGMLHGRMKPEEKDTVMQQFLMHELDILVSTTVIEVGVNVPNATVMLIENAERFGLAQIHQLRGRVGRSEHQGYCYLMLGSSNEPSRRLRALESSSDGFALAELDLEIRGPGAIYGTMQHGQLDLRIAKLSDSKLIAAARQSAQYFIDSNEDLLHYKELNARVHKLRAVTNLN